MTPFTRAWLLAAIVAATSTSLFVDLPSALRVPLAFLQSFVFPGLAVVAWLGGRERRRLDDLALSLLLSPIVLVILVLGAVALTGSFPTALRPAYLAVYALLAVAFLGGRFRVTGASPIVPSSVVWISIGFAGVIAAGFAINTFLALRSDAWFHAMVVEEILTRGVPPLEPRFAELPLRYMWVYHLFMASWKTISGLPLFPALVVFNVVTALVFPYLVARVSGVYRTEPRYAVAAALLAVAGLATAAWILNVPVTLGRFAFGDVQGTNEMSRVLGRIHFDRPQVTHLLAPPGTWRINFLDKFWVITIFTYALNLFLAAFTVVAERGRHGRGDARSLLLLALLVAGTLVFHVVIGAALVVCAIGSGLLLWIWDRVRTEPGGDRFQTVAVPLVTLGVVALLLPFLRSFTAGGEGAGILRYIHPGLRSLATVALPLLLLWGPARGAVRELVAGRSPAIRILATWLIVLLGLNAIVDLPTVNESKLVFPTILLLIPPMAWHLTDAMARRRGVGRALWIAYATLLFAVPPVLTAVGFLRARPLGWAEIRRHVVSTDDRAFYDWVRAATAPTALFAEPNGLELIPVYGARRLLYRPGLNHEAWGYAQASVQPFRTLARDLFGDDPIDAGLISRLRALDREIYIVIWRDDATWHPELARRFDRTPQWFVPEFENEAVRVFGLVTIPPSDAD